MASGCGHHQVLPTHLYPLQIIKNPFFQPPSLVSAPHSYTASTVTPKYILSFFPDDPLWAVWPHPENVSISKEYFTATRRLQVHKISLMFLQVHTHLHRQRNSLCSVENIHIAMYVLIHSYNNDKLFVFFLFLGCDIFAWRNLLTFFSSPILNTVLWSASTKELLLKKITN